MKSSLLSEYKEILYPQLPRLKELLEEKIRGAIGEKGIVIHFVNGRVKTPASLEMKLARPDRNYQDLTDVTDLIAFRVVTFSEDVISQVAALIEDLFDVDFTNSVNKLHHEDSQKFGYRSIHYVCSLPKEIENNFPQHLRAVKFEMQIRTILQHTWAEIEHDVGYKATELLPREFRRRFSQIASLLEVADREFALIRSDLKNYEVMLKSTNFKEKQIDLDRISLLSILEKPEIAHLDQELARFLKAPMEEDTFYLEYILRALHASGLNSIGDIMASASLLKSRLAAFLPVYFEFASQQWRLDKNSIIKVQKGYGLLFLAHLHLLSAEDLYLDKVSRLTAFYRAIDYPEDLVSAKSAAQSLVSALKAGKLLQE